MYYELEYESELEWEWWERREWDMMRVKRRTGDLLCVRVARGVKGGNIAAIAVEKRGRSTVKERNREREGRYQIKNVETREREKERER